MLNEVQDRIHAYRADCRDVTVTADRVVMGYYGVSDTTDDGRRSRTDEAHEYLDAALDALEPGGVVHYHEATPDDLLWERPLARLERAAHDADRPVTVLDRRRVKSHSEGVWHVVLDARFD